ncbi:MAG: radical SAM protein [Planctomycetes bacterium]|nr:radical SAM protein [Planctomycetota bacterium]
MRLRSLAVNPTLKCWYKCRYCKLGVMEHNIPEGDAMLEFSDFERLFRQTREMVEPSFQVHIAGGEPLLYPRILDVIRAATDNELDVQIVTNGALINKRKARDLRKAGVARVGISIESRDAMPHDRIRDEPGSHQAAIRAIQHLSDEAPEIPIQVLTIINRMNLDFLVDVAEWATEDPRISGVTFGALSQIFAEMMPPRWWEVERPDVLWPRDTEYVHAVIDELIERKRNDLVSIGNPIEELRDYKRYFTDPSNFLTDFTCPAGELGIYIDPLGYAQLCGSMPPVGNIKTSSLEELWLTGEETARRRAEILACKSPCHQLLNCHRCAFQDSSEYDSVTPQRL